MFSLFLSSKAAYSRIKGIKLIVLFIMAATVFKLCGCVSLENGNVPSSDSPTEYLFTQVSVTYSEENSQYSFKKDVLHTETAHAHYYFESSLDEGSRQACIDVTDSIIADLSGRVAKPEIYIFSDNTYNGVSIIESSLYTCQNDWQSIDYVTDVILAAYGQCCHYGTAYGYAAILCDRFGWDVPKISNDSMPEEIAVYDLNLLCFDQSFVSEKDASVARQAACRFVSYLMQAYDEETIQHLLSISKTDTGMAELSEKLGEYYSTQGIDYSPSLLRFGYGGISYDYALKSELATFYIGKDWADANLASNPLVTECFLHNDYAETKAFFEISIVQMLNYQKLFDLESYDNELTIIFPNSKVSNQYSYYQSGLHRIIVFNIDSLMHEYIHALTKPSSSHESWEVEGFARYFSYYYDYYGIAFLNEDYNTAAESESTEYLTEFKRTINRPIDMQTDFTEIENIAVYSRGYTDPNVSYVAGSSFVQYLVRLYGEAFVAKCIYGNESFPKPYNELVNEWNQYIEEAYCAFSRYNG